MIGMLPTLRLPWQQLPRRTVRWSPLIPRPTVRAGRCCWACGLVGVSFCAVECLPTQLKPAGSKELV